MRRACGNWIWGSLVLAGCSTTGSGAEGDAGGDDALFEIADAAEASAPAPVDAGPLWESCDPASPSGCPTGLECLGAHTAPVDGYGTCVFTCAGSNGPACTLSGGTCACPSPSAAGAPGDCSAGSEAGTVTVCVPAGDAGAAGNNELMDTGAPDEDAGEADASDGGG